MPNYSIKIGGVLKVFFFCFLWTVIFHSFFLYSLVFFHLFFIHLFIYLFILLFISPFLNFFIFYFFFIFPLFIFYFSLRFSYLVFFLLSNRERFVNVVFVYIQGIFSPRGREIINTSSFKVYIQPVLVFFNNIGLFTVYK